MSNNEAGNDITLAEVLEFLKDNMVMDSDFDEFKKTVTTKDDLKAIEKRFDSLDARLFEFQSELEDIKDKLSKIEMRLKEDTDALADDILELRGRVSRLEQQLGIQFAAHSV